jgi:hypothetical protein
MFPVFRADLVSGGTLNPTNGESSAPTQILLGKDYDSKSKRMQLSSYHLLAVLWTPVIVPLYGAPPRAECYLQLETGAP